MQKYEMQMKHFSSQYQYHSYSDWYLREKHLYLKLNINTNINKSNGMKINLNIE